MEAGWQAVHISSRAEAGFHTAEEEATGDRLPKDVFLGFCN